MSSIENPRVRLGASTGDWWELRRGWSCWGTGGGEGLWDRSNKELSDWLVEETSWQPSRCSRWCLFASLCVNKWVFKFDLWLKLLLHTGHLWGDSSMCKILCTAKVLDWQNPFPHSVHLNGFSLECMYLERMKINVNLMSTFTCKNVRRQLEELYVNRYQHESLWLNRRRNNKRFEWKLKWSTLQTH